MLSAPRNFTWIITEASSLAAQLLCLPSWPSPPRSTRGSFSVKVRSHPSSAQNLPMAHTHSECQPTSCKSPHSLTPVNSQASPPPAPASSALSIGLPCNFSNTASGPLHLLFSLPETSPRILMAHSLSSFRSWSDATFLVRPSLATLVKLSIAVTPSFPVPFPA